MYRTCLLVVLALASSSAFGAERWQTLPPDAAPVTMARHGYVTTQGARLYYAITGTGSPVLLLHGSLQNCKIGVCKIGVRVHLI